MTQEALAARFGVSRIPVREALRRLEAEGLVIIHANRGTSVTELSGEEIHEIYELRMLLEGDLMARSVPRLTAQDLRHAEFLHGSLERERDPDRQDRLNREFHAVLYGPAGRPRQQALAENLRNLVERYQNATRTLMQSTPAFQKDHQRILTACRRRNARQARAQVVRHLEHALRVVLSHVGSLKEART